MDKAMVEYQGKDGHPTRASGESASEETSWHGEDFRTGVSGNFVKQKVLFEGEKSWSTGYMTMWMDTAGLRQKDRWSATISWREEENSRFACLNEMGTALKDKGPAGF